MGMSWGDLNPFNAIADIANSSTTDPASWAHYNVSGGSNDGDKSAAVLAAAAKALGISQNDPTFKAAASQADVASKVGWGGSSPDQIIALVTKDYNNLVANPTSTPEGQQKAAAAAALPAQQELTAAQGRLDTLYANQQTDPRFQSALDALGISSGRANDIYGAASDPSSPLAQKLAAIDPYNTQGKAFQDYVGSQQQQAAQGMTGQEHELLGGLMGAGATSGEVAARKAALSGQQAGTLEGIRQNAVQQAYQLGPQWKQNQLNLLSGFANNAANPALQALGTSQGQTNLLAGLANQGAGIAGQQGNLALGGNALQQGAYQFNTNMDFQKANTPNPYAAMAFDTVKDIGQSGAKAGVTKAMGG